MFRVERVTVLPPDFGNLVRESEAEGFAFVRRLESEWKDGSNGFDRVGEFLLAAYCSNKIVGICGLNIDPYVADPDVARLRHLYVSPAHRSDGLGSILVSQCLEHLDSKFKRLRLRVPDRATGEFYEKLGFLAVEDATASHVIEIADRV